MCCSLTDLDPFTLYFTTRKTMYFATRDMENSYQKMRLYKNNKDFSTTNKM